MLVVISVLTEKARILWKKLLEFYVRNIIMYPIYQVGKTKKQKTSNSKSYKYFL